MDLIRAFKYYLFNTSNSAEPKPKVYNWPSMKTVLGIGVVAELLGFCLAFAPTTITPRFYSSSFTPQIARCYQKLVPTAGNFQSAYCFSHVDDNDDDDCIDDTGKVPKWNEITPELRLAGENFISGYRGRKTT